MDSVIGMVPSGRIKDVRGTVPLTLIKGCQGDGSFDINLTFEEPSL